MVTFVLGVSILLQFTAAVLALRLARVTGNRKAWILIATAIFLMAIRRFIPFFRLISGGWSHLPDFATEWIGLITSALMVAGIAWIAPLFYSVQRQEEALQKSEHKIRLITENMRDTIFVYDMNRQLQYVNPAFETLTGYTTKELYEKNFINYIHPDDETRMIKLWEELFQGNAFAGKEFRIITKDGHIKWCLSSWSPLFNEKGNQIGAQGRETDITESKRSEEEYRTIVRTAINGFWIVDMQGLFLDVNDAYCRLIGYSRDELLTMKISDVEAVERPEETAQRIQKIMEVGGDRFETRHKCKDGRIIDIEVSVNYMEVGGGRMFVFLRDITERKRAEEALRKSEEITKQLAQENATVAEIGRIISSTLNIDEVYEKFGQEVRKIIPFDRIAINIINPGDHTVTVAYATGIEVTGRQIGDIFPIAGTQTEKAIRTRSTQFLQVANKEELLERFPALLPPFFRTGVRSLISVPLISKNQVIGVLNFRSAKPNIYSEADLRLAERVGTQIVGAIANAQLFKDRKRAEEALREGERFLTSIFTSIQDGISILDNDFNIIRINPMQDKWHSHASPLIGKKCYEAYHNRNERCEVCPSYQTIQTGMPAYEIIPRTGEEGKLIGWLDLFSFPFTDIETGKVKGVIEYTRDITDRKRAEEEIQRQSALLDAINKVFREVLMCETEEELASMCLSVTEKLTGSKFGFIGELNQAGLLDTLAISNPGWDACKMPKSEASMLIRNMEVRGIWGSVLENNQSIIVNDPTSHPDRVGIPDGHPLIISFLGVPLKQTGRTIGIIAIANKESDYDLVDQHDVETLSIAFVEALMRKRAEKALQQGEKRFRQLYDEAPVGYHEVDAEGRITRVNRTELEMLGYTEEEMIGQPLWKFLVEEEKARQTITAKLSGSMQPGRAFERNYKRKDGTTLPVLIEDRLLQNEEGRIIGIRSTIQNITDRKRAEEALRKSEAKFKSLFDEAPVGYMELDTKGRITQVNRTELAMLGYSAEEMIGQPIWKFNVKEEESRQRVTAKLSGSMQTGKPFKRTYKRKDGTTLPVLLDDSVIRDAEGRVTGIHAVIQDITERKRTEEEMVTLQEQLRQSQKMEAIGRLAGGIAHDFNNLLTVIKGYTQLSLVELNEMDPLKGNLQEIKKASDRAADLTRQLLAFSRRQILDFKVLDLNMLLQDLGKMLHRILGEDIELVYVLAEDLGKIKTDPGQIEQVILNLAVNARDAMPSVGKLIIETANVELDETYARTYIGATPGHYVMVSVSDTGYGMSPEVKEHIFEPFFTTKEKSKGTGLGLSTVYGIVKQSGGYIWVDSEPGCGTTFKIYLPRVEEEASVLHPTDDTSSLPCGSETVLIVEDEPSVRGLVVRVLRELGYTLIEAANGEEALHIVQEQDDKKINLLLTDVVMPQMGGKELADQLKIPQPDIKVLFISGYTDDAIVRHGVLEPGTNFLQKPFSPSALTHKVREVLDR